MQLYLKDFDAPHILSLLNIYLSEYEHRDERLWKQTYRSFYAVLIVILLPNIAEKVGIDLSKFPAQLFPIIGLFLSFFYLYVSLGYTKRLEASWKTYQIIIDTLPKELQRIPLADSRIKRGKLFKHSMSPIICSLMFFALIALSLIMLMYHTSS